jgi:hypothetical protein
VDITAGTDVAFVAALMRCAGTEMNGKRIELEFREPRFRKHSRVPKDRAKEEFSAKNG